MKRAMVVGTLAMLGAGQALGAERGQTLDATVSSSAGRPVQLARYWGRPTLLFYEDRDSAELNQAFKDQLYARARARGLLSSATLVAVAYLAPFDWFPARQFALAAVRDAEKKFGIPILVDWTGALAAPPWNLSTRNSTVLVLNAQGKVVFEAAGKLDGEKAEEVFAAIEGML